MLAGEPVLKYNAILKYPYYSEPVYYNATLGHPVPAGSDAEEGDVKTYGSQV